MIGKRLAHYEITAHLGSGGMGDVYAATDSKLGRSVALKLLPQEFAADPERLARFRREAQVLASLSHPGIAAIHGFEDAGGRPFLVMELVSGETLQARLKRGPIPVDEALAIAKQIAEALEAAHDKGIVHRDLKPGNVMLTADGKVKVLDFGLAKSYEANPSNPVLSNSPTMASMAATNAGIILGTAAYMAPEQARGRTSTSLTTAGEWLLDSWMPRPLGRRYTRRTRSCSGRASSTTCGKTSSRRSEFASLMIGTRLAQNFPDELRRRVPPGK